MSSISGRTRKFLTESAQSSTVKTSKATIWEMGLLLTTMPSSPPVWERTQSSAATTSRGIVIDSPSPAQPENRVRIFFSSAATMRWRCIGIR